MRLAVWVFTAALVLAFGTLAWNFARDEGTRDRLRVVERGPAAACVSGDAKACRKLAAALDRYFEAHPKRAKKLAGGAVRDALGTPGGGGAGTAPTGGGPIGRVPAPGSPPDTTPPSHPDTEPPDEPAVNLDAPLIPRVCVGDLLAVNC